MNIIETKFQWNGKLKGENNPKIIILHHVEASNCTAQDIDRWHKEKGWAGIGYHFFVKKNGVVFRGRPENVIGAHCLNHNTNSLGISVEGCYMSETMPEAQKEAIIELGQYLVHKYGISTIKGHKEFNATDCPGVKFPLEQIKASILNGCVSSSAVNMTVKSFQHAANLDGIEDENSNVLIEDGKLGAHTKAVIEKIGLIKTGVKGTVVSWVQQRLNELGFSCGSVDGVFGIKTLTAVQHFQVSRHLKNDGIVGPITINELLK